MFTSFTIVMIFVGPCLGSFASAMAFRAPLQKSWIFASADEAAAAGVKSARSSCPSCGGSLGFFDLVPILSWVFLRGRCRHCHKPISGLYPALEIAALGLSLAFLHLYGPGLTLVLHLCALPFLLALLVISAKGQPLSNQILLILLSIAAVFAVVRVGFSPEPFKLALNHVTGFVAYGAFGLLLPLIRVRLYKVRAEAVGEVTLLAAAGLWFGMGMFPAFLIVAGFYGMAWAASRLIAQKARPVTMTHAFVGAFLMLMLFAERFSELSVRAMP